MASVSMAKSNVKVPAVPASWLLLFLFSFVDKTSYFMHINSETLKICKKYWYLYSGTLWSTYIVLKYFRK